MMVRHARQGHVLLTPLVGDTGKASIKKIAPLFDFCSGRDAEIAANSLVIGSRYVFKHVYHSGFEPRVLGDALLLDRGDLEKTFSLRTGDHICDMFFQHGFKLGDFSACRRDLMRLRPMERWAVYNPVSPRPEGDVFEMVVEPKLEMRSC